MSNDNSENISMKEMMEAIEGSLKRIQSGDVVKGTVISVSDEEVFVNIGYMADGIITKEELSDEDVNPKEILKQGDEIDVLVLEVNDGEGNVSLSLKRAEYYKVWENFGDALKNGSTITVKINEAVKGGVIANVRGIRSFIPASQLSVNYVENLNDYIGKVMEVKVIEFDEDNEKVILSRKEVEKEQQEIKKQEVWDSIKKGEKRRGVIKRLAKFGAFVDIGGVDGLIFNSDLSWKRVADPSEIVSVGDLVDVYVIDFDKAKGKISLALKELANSPWKNIYGKYKVGNIYEVTVVKITDFGAFVELEPGIEGLVHVSQISEERVSKPSSILNLGDKVKVKIIEINENDKKMSLSMKDAVEYGSGDYSDYFSNSNEDATIGELLKDQLKNFKFQ